MTVYIVEGIIGAGKTTLLTYLYDYFTKSGLKTAICLEPVDLWEEIGILGKFYADPVKYGYIFQSFVYITRIEKIKKMFIEYPNYDIYLIERSPFSDKLFMSIQHLCELELKMYLLWCDTFNELLPFKMENVKLIYLKPNIKVCQERVAKRNRQSESSVSFEYQQKLIAVHNYYFENIQIPVELQSQININLLGICNIPFKNRIIIEEEIINHNYIEDKKYEQLLIDKILNLS